jgi:hypothetical protein
MTATLAEKQFTLEVINADPAALTELTRVCLQEIDSGTFDESLRFRLSVIFARAIDLFDSVQDLIEEILTKLRDLQTSERVPSHQQNGLLMLTVSFWNICKKKNQFRGIHAVTDAFLDVKESAATLTSTDVRVSAARLFGHDDLITECVQLAVAYYPFNDQEWYRQLMSDAVMFVATRRGLTTPEQLALICLTTHWEYPSRRLDVFTIRTFLEKRVVCTTLKLGMLFMLDSQCHNDLVRRNFGGSLEVALRRQFPEDVNSVLDALLDSK